MPYTTRTIFLPHYGHEAQVQQAVKERVPTFHAAGVRASVWQELAGPDRLAIYGVINLDKLTDVTETTRGEGARAGDIMRERLEAHVREARTAYFEILYSATGPGGGRQLGSYISVETHTPLAGKAAELRGVCVDLGKFMESRGSRVNVQVEMAGPQAGNCEITQFFSSLDEMEDWRASLSDADRRQTDAPFQGVAGAPATIRLLRNVIPTA